MNGYQWFGKVYLRLKRTPSITLSQLAQRIKNTDKSEKKSDSQRI